ncbi:hypothetical protein [Riemerella anatipestifer]|uniref:Uncharacterized protein n=2 Tax=Riemerella anatipestifer TaxID=34085 RepID=A0AAP3ASJ8_RIEAN|nr:hypothetical protein [Riemerella anatipestifer]AZZ58953.1 hypothetical protein AWB57_07875 [Riemerella anatipestifer]MBT0550856.1 hypothetical protein [Riemerella anatipestifer]MBT0553002.1 hypothetical protein [Riemerella anatipestifer]MBT0573229.1 hypothetical protein [Riemerella anatipestifer]MCE3023699.1 hypothetical protein [Riemerella anatipestifer]
MKIIKLTKADLDNKFKMTINIEKIKTMQENQNNQEQNFNENQPIDNGMELLKKVIQSNEENIELMVNFSHNVEDLANIVGHLESTVRTANYNIKVLEKMKDEFLERFKQLIGTIPKSINAHLSEQSILKMDELSEKLEKFEKKKKFYEKFNLTALSMFVLSVLVMFLCFYFSKQWYNTSIQTKMEIRAELLQEIKNDKKVIYNKSEVEQLQYNTDLINKWMKKNPKDAEKFLKFKDGYEAR